MPKSKSQKQATVEILAAGLKAAKGAVFANFQGLTVAQSEELRRQCRAERITMIAAKKTLVKRALEAVGLGDVDINNFRGGVAAFMGQSDEVAPAKVVAAFAKKAEMVILFGGILEGKFIDAAMAMSLAKLPGKSELLGKLVGTLQAPVSGFVNTLAGNLRNLVGVLNNIQKSKG